MMGAGILNTSREMWVSFLNDTKAHITLPRAHCCGVATELECSVSEDEPTRESERVGVRRVETEGKEVPDQKPPKPLPENVQTVFDRARPNVAEHRQGQVTALLHNYADVFSAHEFDIGEFDLLQHEIQLHDPKPFRQSMRRTPQCFQKKEEKTLAHMLEAKVIQPSTSGWASAPVLVRKKDGSLRYCIDYRNLNYRTIKDAFPLPLIEECLDTLNGSQYFSCLDMASGYWQISIKPQDRPKTAFVTKYGLYEHVRMGFGLCNAPATFSRAMNLVLRRLTHNQVLAYLDDVVIIGRTFEEHMGNLTTVLQRFRRHNLKLKPKKCNIFHKDY
jgi:hypothetical protein